MKYAVDIYGRFGVSVEVEADSAEEAEDKAWIENLWKIVGEELSKNNGFIEPELYEANKLD